MEPGAELEEGRETTVDRDLTEGRTIVPAMH